MHGYSNIFKENKNETQHTHDVFWTVVAAVFTVMFINMFMSLGPDARAMLVGVLFAAFFCVPIGVLAFTAGRRADLRTAAEPTEDDADLEAYFVVDRAVSRLACASQAAYEQGRDDARRNAARQIATDRAIAMLTSEEQGT